ncbi:hypothetical protein Q0L86_14520, partial [Staphylococcus aureus]|nr:hypothetical protein [Staphylococcus aureus]
VFFFGAGYFIFQINLGNGVGSKFFFAKFVFLFNDFVLQFLGIFVFYLDFVVLFLEIFISHFLL